MCCERTAAHHFPLDIGMKRLTLIAEPDGFIQTRPITLTVTKSLKAGSSIFNKVGHDIFGRPAAILILQGERRVPMISKVATGVMSGVYRIITMISPGLVDRSSSEWKNKRTTRSRRSRC